jgi:hypothetical protein
MNGMTYFSIRMAPIRMMPVSSPDVVPCHTPMDTARMMSAMKDSVMYATWNFLVRLIPPIILLESFCICVNISATPDICTI